MEKVKDFNNTYCVASGMHYYMLAINLNVHTKDLKEVARGYFAINCTDMGQSILFYSKQTMLEQLNLKQIEYNSEVDDWVYVDSLSKEIEEKDYIQAPNSDIKFKKPNFECKLFFEDQWFIYGKIGNQAYMWDKIDGSSVKLATSIGTLSAPEYDLTLYKPKWYEDLGDGVFCWVWNDNMPKKLDIIEQYYPNTNNKFRGQTTYWQHAQPLTKEESMKYIKEVK